MVLAELDGDWRTPLPEKVPLGHIERRWFRYVLEALLFGHRLNRDLITIHWSDVHRVTDVIGLARLSHR